MPGESEIEIRQIFDTEDFGEAFTPELRAQIAGQAQRWVSALKRPAQPAGFGP